MVASATLAKEASWNERATTDAGTARLQRRPDITATHAAELVAHGRCPAVPLAVNRVHQVARLQARAALTAGGGFVEAAAVLSVAARQSSAALRAARLQKRCRGISGSQHQCV